MFLPFKIREEEIRKLETEGYMSIRFLKNYQTVNSFIYEYARDNAYGALVDGSRLEEDWFPTKGMPKFNVFISHSHNDIWIVKRFASWLENKLGLTCFIDSLYWKNSDALLADLDKNHCSKCDISDDEYYSYGLRDEIASHIHTMLSMALMKMMDQTECVIFVESDKALPSRRNQTTSQWIYEEINFANMLQMKVPKGFYRGLITDSTRYHNTRLYSDTNFQILYDVDFNRFGNLTANSLWDIYKKKGMTVLPFMKFLVCINILMSMCRNCLVR